MELEEKYTLNYGVENKDGTSVAYEDLVKDRHPNVDWFFEEYEGSYQGDFYMLGKSDGKYYFFTISYGSCSGCDWLDSIETYDKLEELIAEIDGKVLVKSRDDMKNWLDKYDFNDWLDDDERVERRLRKAFSEN
jgi:hypothetical protein